MLEQTAGFGLRLVTLFSPKSFILVLATMGHCTKLWYNVPVIMKYTESHSPVRMLRIPEFLLIFSSTNGQNFSAKFYGFSKNNNDNSKLLSYIITEDQQQ